MRKALILALALGVILVAGASASGPDLGSYTPEQVKELATAPVDNSEAELKVTKIDPSQFDAPASAPATPLEQCWHLEGGWKTWGHWPAEQKLREVRDWCAQYVGGPQTRRVTHVLAGTGGWGSICSWDNLYAYLVSGGNGYTWSVVQSGGHFFCRPWNFANWIRISCNTWGNCAWVDTNGPAVKPA